MTKPCYGLCARCVWRDNGGCSEWPKWEDSLTTMFVAEANQEKDYIMIREVQ